MTESPAEAGLSRRDLLRILGRVAAANGLGLAAVRDFASYLKHGAAGAALRERPALMRRVIGFGRIRGPAVRRVEHQRDRCARFGRALNGGRQCRAASLR